MSPACDLPVMLAGSVVVKSSSQCTVAQYSEIREAQMSNKLGLSDFQNISLLAKKKISETQNLDSSSSRVSDIFGTILIFCDEFPTFVDDSCIFAPRVSNTLMRTQVFCVRNEEFRGRGPSGRTRKTLKSTSSTSSTWPKSTFK